MKNVKEKQHFSATFIPLIFLSLLLLSGGPAYSEVEADKTITNIVPEKKDTISWSIPRMKANISIEAIVDNYLKVKNSLALDNAEVAAKAAVSLQAAIERTNTALLTSKQKKAYKKLADDAKARAKDIIKDKDRIDKQRKHFSRLSKDVSELVETFGSIQKLYLDFCPMYNENGAIWISETREIKNPYYGKDMFSCGSIQKELS